MLRYMHIYIDLCTFACADASTLFYKYMQIYIYKCIYIYVGYCSGLWRVARLRARMMSSASL